MIKYFIAKRGRGMGCECKPHSALGNPCKTRIPPPLDFLSWITIGLIQFDSSTGNISLATSILLISSFTLSFIVGFNQYDLLLINLASGFSLIYILPSSPLILFISVKFRSDRSTDSLSRVTTLDIMSSLNNLQWKLADAGFPCQYPTA